MRNDALSPDPDPVAAPSGPAAGCGARFELALVAAFKGGAVPAIPCPARSPIPRS